MHLITHSSHRRRVRREQRELPSSGNATACGEPSHWCPGQHNGTPEGGDREREVDQDAHRRTRDSRVDHLSTLRVDGPFAAPIGSQLR